MWPVPRSATEGPNGAYSALDIGGRAGVEQSLPPHLAHIGGDHIRKKRLEQSKGIHS